MGTMWGFGWIFPLFGLFICLVFFGAVVRAMAGRGGIMCTGAPHHEAADTAQLRREVQALREEVNRLKASR